MKKPVIISTDPGIDDAVALAICLFSPAIEVKSIIATNGNVNAQQALINILKLEKFFGKSIPVVKGVERSLVQQSIRAKEIHGKSGMDGYDFPNPSFELVDHGISPVAIHKIVAASSEKVTLIGIAPLTDYALYVRLYPDDIKNIKELIIMGGAMGRGNYGIYSEFNIASDPEAAKIIFESGLKIRVAPLELGAQAKIMPEVSNQIRQLGKAGDMFYDLFKKFRGGSFQTGLKIYDALAAGVLLNPQMFKFKNTHVEIDVQTGYTYGASLMDFKNKLDLPNNAEIAVSVDPEIFSKWFVEALSKTR
ncbi:nucleoside hydrolase [Lactobacillus crispatus]|jgi:inosine-uridine nucleoside N-ribohydrolase|uniref:Ribonucleoside hydrolase RihC n=1 Tax=Lactobacillus crispatus TaxID=47770 RepID=A0A4Q0LQD8_9LACO|nr:nucleoside hydrolase [Lactobacillus crispatus]MBG0731679.1 ribonucleoside hydrolase RihC [Lactobacillus crispatus]MBI1712776.1 nucleoside hydrolase [Lactobacillus crispatus]MCZ3862928.1 nucleoside hydrolase [Lactobacillus crispatus]MCZ3918904.1 nucleoside hydrolase [Lactobacillus crispatus]MCZ3920992.1 nucleoside hydrolase [Lactobacillus crispatus]